MNQDYYAFATVFIEGANRELKGADSDQRIEAAEQLRAALDQLEPPVYNPDIHRSSTEPYPVNYGICSVCRQEQGNTYHQHPCE
jgi:hypothetical protein